MPDHTWFVLKDDPEAGYSSIEDAVDNYCLGEVVELEECKVVRGFYAVWMWAEGDEREVREFDTVEAAESWVSSRRAAIVT